VKNRPASMRDSAGEEGISEGFRLAKSERAVSGGVGAEGLCHLTGASVGVTMTPPLYSHLHARFQPHAPIAGLLMQVCDCDNDDFDACRLIDQAIGESLHLTTANRATQRVSCQWKTVDTPDGLPGLITKLVPQPNALRVVVPDCLNKLLMRGRQESCLQTFFPRSAKTRSASIAPSSPAR